MLHAAKVTAVAALEAERTARAARPPAAPAVRVQRDEREEQIAALQRECEVEYALQDTPSQFELTMLGTRPLHRHAPGADVNEPPDAKTSSGSGRAARTAGVASGALRTNGGLGTNRQQHSKRFHFAPGGPKAGERGHPTSGQPFRNCFQAFTLAEHERGQKLQGDGARPGGYYVHGDARYDFQHQADKHHGLPEYDGPAWTWDQRRLL